ncbi:hypothetical protein Cp1R7AA1_124 [Mesorhizobium phage Cp1R7A-A1]|nr:hypothetical protein Cp1R7AA1_124 [Mesorhizobium phage Cp1R7A-A1]
MSRPVEEPVVTSEDRFGSPRTTTTHPAFGQISGSRVSGRAVLYGSDFTHNAAIRIRIASSELNRDLHHDWHFSRKEYIEVELSEAQWANFVSALNVGDGTPCTIRHIGGKMMPALPDPVDRSHQFKAEIDERLAKSLEGLRAAIKEIEELGLPKGKTDKATAAMRKTLQDLEANLPFAAQSFGKHAEGVVEKAKAEIHGYMTGVINRTGLAALQGQPMPLAIEKPHEDDE